MWESKPDLVDGLTDGDVSRQRLRPVGETLVDPVELVRVLVALEQVLILVGEDALVETRPGGCARARVVRRVVRRIRAGAMQPVERVDRHHVAIEEVVDLRREESRDVREAAGVVRVVEVRVADVRDERDDLVAVTRVVVERQLGSSRPVPGRRHAERRRLLRVDVGVELADQARDLRVARRRCEHRRCGSRPPGSRVPESPGAAVRHSLALHPDLDVLARAPASVNSRIR